MPNTQFSRQVGLVGLMLVGLSIVSLTWLQPTTRAQSPTHPQITATATLCPVPTFEQFWVEPVTSPTNLLTQTVQVYISSNGDAITVTSESGTFAHFGAYPHWVTMTLSANITHHLIVTGHVRPTSNGGCQYGNYGFVTTTDRNGDPLTIVQEFSGPRIYLPVVVRSANLAPSATVP